MSGCWSSGKGALVLLEVPQRRGADDLACVKPLPARDLPRDLRLLDRLLVAEPLETRVAEKPQVDRERDGADEHRQLDPLDPAAFLELVDD